MSRVFISPLATPFHSLVSIFPIPSRYISIFRAPPPRYFSPSLSLDPNEHPYFEEIRHLTVSAHFLIERDGAITQFVSCHDRAWHAGVSCFDGREACNDFSLGIELEGTDTEPYTDAQYTALAGLTRLLRAAFPAITPERIQGHCDIAPERKTDPGEAFDWSRYRAGLTDSKEET